MFRLTVMDSDRWITDGIAGYFSERSIRVNVIEDAQIDNALLFAAGSDVVISELCAFGRDVQTFTEMFLRLRRLSPATKLIILTGIEEKAVIRYIASLLPDASVLSKRCEIIQLADEVFSCITAKDVSKAPPVIKRRNGALTPREFGLLRMLATKKSLTEIGHLVQLSVKTISHHKKNIMRKLDCHSSADLSPRLRRMGFGDNRT